LNAPSPGPPTITVIGDGLAGTVLALVLAQRGARVELVGGPDPNATALSYGALPRGGPSRAWRRLERVHGPLGWRPSGLVLHEAREGLPRHLAALSQRLPLPLARVDIATWRAARSRALASQGVGHRGERVRGLKLQPQGGWTLDGVPGLVADTVVLAAGAGCRELWPSLPPRFRHSWAGVLLLEAGGPPNPWLDQARRGRIVQPRRWRRPALEAAAATSEGPSWIVDAGLAPWGQGVVVGQISLIPPAATGLEPPDPRWMEERLRDGLGALDPGLAHLQAPYRQVAVSFCVDGQPLVGPVPGAPGLWAFTGFSAAFSRVPALAEALATRLLAKPEGTHSN